MTLVTLCIYICSMNIVSASALVEDAEKPTILSEAVLILVRKCSPIFPRSVAMILEGY